MGIRQRKRTERIERPYLRALTWRRAPQKNPGPSSLAGRVEWGRLAELPPAWGRVIDSEGLPHRWAVWVAAPGLKRLAIVEARLRAALAVVRAVGVDYTAFGRLRAACPDLRVDRNDAGGETQCHLAHARALSTCLARAGLVPVTHIVSAPA